MKSSTTINNTLKKWIVLEKIISVILLTWSIIVIYSLLSVATEMIKYNYVSGGEISFTKTLLSNHVVLIVAILGLFGSCMLLYKDKNGWMLCVVTSLIFAVILFISVSMKSNNDKLPFANNYKSYSLIGILFSIIFFLLLIRPIRQRYMPTTNTWLWIAGITLLLLLDRIIF